MAHLEVPVVVTDVVLFVRVELRRIGDLNNFHLAALAMLGWRFRRPERRGRHEESSGKTE